MQKSPKKSGTLGDIDPFAYGNFALRAIERHICVSGIACGADDDALTLCFEELYSSFRGAYGSPAVMSPIPFASPFRSAVRLAPCIMTLCLIAGCSGANHIGNPLTLPIGAIVSAAENGGYNRERAAVKAWIAENETAMRTEGFFGPATDSLLMTLPPETRGQARRDLVEAAPFADFVERATVVVMVFRG